mmetsp:Transcript_68709/g.212431  ORF Transcript_68709/g.212431 Transcript_68709/m.212431 type:complete len:215 (+) Transcript_68709:75-719(+)
MRGDFGVAAGGPRTRRGARAASLGSCPRRGRASGALSAASTWAAASARTLTRRLRRRRALPALGDGVQAHIEQRVSDLRRVLEGHARLERLAGVHYHHMGQAIAAVAPSMPRAEVAALRVDKRLGDHARHAAFHPADAAAGLATTTSPSTGACVSFLLEPDDDLADALFCPDSAPPFIVLAAAWRTTAPARTSFLVRTMTTTTTARWTRRRTGT